MEKYIQIYDLNEAMDNETVCVCYPNPFKNISGKKNEECILEAEKEAHEEKCRLFVWRKIDEPDNEKYFTLAPRDIEQLTMKYNNAKSAMREYQEQDNIEYKIEYGKTLAFESVFEMLGFDLEEVRRKYWIDGD